MNISVDGSGTHIKNTDRYDVRLDTGSSFVYNKDIQPDPVMLERFKAFYLQIKNTPYACIGDELMLKIVIIFYKYCIFVSC